MNQNWIEKWKSDDLIFHYTKFNIAEEHILKSLTLILKDRMDSSDPIEKFSPLVSMGGYFNHDEDVDYLFELHRNDFENLKSELKKFKQSCFCMNNKTLHSYNKLIPLEEYGFLKQRMWDQYGDNYKGVCLALSKKELLKDPKLEGQKINYKNFMELRKMSYRIDINELKNKGFEEYKLIYLKKLKNNFYTKHIDYQNESEFRIITSRENKKDKIDISNSLKGIIINPEYITNKNRTFIEDFTKSMNIPLIKLGWNHNGVYLFNSEGISQNDFFQKNAN